MTVKYYNFLCITCTPNFGWRNPEKGKKLCIIRTEVLEFLATKFSLNFAFVQSLSIPID